jgi:hypothetical protein
MSGAPQLADWPAAGEATAGGVLRCDAVGCLYRPPGAPGDLVAIDFDASALPEDCGASFVVSTVPIYGRCPAALGHVDRFDLWRNGTYAVTFTAHGAIVESVAAARGERPWAPARGAQ